MGRYQGEEKILISIDLGTTMSPYTLHTRLFIRALTDPFRRRGGLHAFVPRFNAPSKVRAFLPWSYPTSEPVPGL